MSKRTTRISPMSIEEAIGENVRLGYIEVFGVDENGDPVYKITPAGEAHVQELLGLP